MAALPRKRHRHPSPLFPASPCWAGVLSIAPTEAVGVERLTGFNREVVVVHVARDKRGFGDRHIAVRAVAEQTDPVGSSGLGESRAGTKKKDQARDTKKWFGKDVKVLHW